MKFIDEFNKEKEERIALKKLKSSEIKNNENELNKVEEEVKALEKRYFLQPSNELLESLREVKSKRNKLKEIYDYSIEELDLLNKNYLFKYDPEEIFEESKALYEESKIDETILKIKSLEEEQKKLKQEVLNEWNDIENEVLMVTSKINKLYLDNDQRIKLCEKIDNYISNKGVVLLSEGFRVDHKKMEIQELIKNSI